MLEIEFLVINACKIFFRNKNVFGSFEERTPNLSFVDRAHAQDGVTHEYKIAAEF